MFKAIAVKLAWRYGPGIPSPCQIL